MNKGILIIASAIGALVGLSIVKELLFSTEEMLGWHSFGRQ